MQNIGIFGGSFNPVHNEHFALCEYLLKKLELNKIILVPNAAPPHKSPLVTSFEHRCNMLKLQGFTAPNYEISDLEDDPLKPHYSIVMVQNFKKCYPKDRLFFIIGLDSLVTLDEWKNGFSLTDFTHLAVVGREGYSLDMARPPVQNFLMTHALYESDRDHIYYRNSKPSVQDEGCDIRTTQEHYCLILRKSFSLISATLIREELKAMWQKKAYLHLPLPKDEFKGLRHHVHPMVLQYIIENHLYSE